MIAAAVAIGAVVIVGGAIWLGGSPEHEVVVVGSDTTTTGDSNDAAHGGDTTTTGDPIAESGGVAEGEQPALCDGPELPDLSAAMPDGFTGPFDGPGGGAEGPACATHWQGPVDGSYIIQAPGSSPFGLAPDREEGPFRWGSIHEGFGFEYSGDPAWNVAIYGLDEQAFDRFVQAVIAGDS